MLRWKCESCDLTWIYPVKKCAHCKGPIKTERSEKAKVIGITKIAIPSTLHPVVPYYVILLEDEYGNRMPKKTMTRYEIGQEYKEKTATTDSAVAITRQKYDYEDAVKHALDLINVNVGEWKGKTILIKPSITFPAYPYQGVNTNPPVLDALLTILKSAGIDKANITVAEQAPKGIPTAAAAAKAGLVKVCQKHEVNMLDFADSAFSETKSKSCTFNIAKPVLEADIVINLPVMKTHSQWKIAGAMENLIRITDDQTQQKMHEEKPDEQLAQLVSCIRTITIADASVGMQGQGPYLSGEPTFLNMILASKDPVALDTVYANIGFYDQPSYAQIAHDQKIGTADLKKIEVVGYDLEAVRAPLLKANKNMGHFSKIEVIDGKSWPAEYTALYGLVSKLAAAGGKEFSIVSGKLFEKEEVENKPVLLAYGDGAIRRLQDLGVKPLASLKGSPPDTTESILLLKKMLEKQSVSMMDKMQTKILGGLSSIKK